MDSSWLQSICKGMWDCVGANNTNSMDSVQLRAAMNTLGKHLSPQEAHKLCPMSYTQFEQQGTILICVSV